MGWTYTDKRKGESVVDFLQRMWGKKYIIHDSATKGDAVYMACEHIDRPGIIFAAVTEIDRSGDDCFNFGFKDMDETVGPYQVECPARILDKLTPTESQNALEWRQACRDRLAKTAAKPKLQAGDKLQFLKPINFTSGASLDSFEVSDPIRMIVLAEGKGLFRLNRRVLADHDNYKVTRKDKVIHEPAQPQEDPAVKAANANQVARLVEMIRNGEIESPKDFLFEMEGLGLDASQQALVTNQVCETLQTPTLEQALETDWQAPTPR